MAYINEYVPKGEERTFHIGEYGNEVIPTKWTIDKEKDYIFFEEYTEIDEPVNQHFIFVYKSRVITMILDGSEFADPDTKIWKIAGITIPDDISREEVLSELREALTTYGCFGTPPDFEFRSTRGKVIIDF